MAIHGLLISPYPTNKNLLINLEKQMKMKQYAVSIRMNSQIEMVEMKLMKILNLIELFDMYISIEKRNWWRNDSSNTKRQCCVLG
jgi:hypothetical protein